MKNLSIFIALSCFMWSMGSKPKAQCIGQNEQFVECGNSCSESCDVQGKNIACPAMCAQGCFCKSGFARDSTGRCILKNLCRNNSNTNNPCAKMNCDSGKVCINGINGPTCDSPPMVLPEPEPGFKRRG